MPEADAIAAVSFDRGRQVAPQVYERLRDAIISLTLPPSTVLSRAELAERFGVSMTPIRDALMRLADEHLVEVFAQHATVVTAIDIEKSRQAQFLRALRNRRLQRGCLGPRHRGLQWQQQ